VFNRKSQSDTEEFTAPAQPRRAIGGSAASFSIIGGDMEIAGNVKASVDLHIDGRIDGDVSCASLVQGAGSVIRGAVSADTAKVAGTIEGSIDAEHLFVESTARIVGDVSYTELTVSSGGMIDGQMKQKTAPANVRPIRTDVAAD
jgi:cytoskeletal protein CcmA (bactofilin family)